MLRGLSVCSALVCASTLLAQDFQQRRTLSGHNEPLRAIALSRDGQVLASATGQIDGKSSALKVWNPAKGKARDVRHGATVTAVALTRDGKTLASAGGGLTLGGFGKGSKLLPAEVKLWDAATG